jgi:tetratricopeptide (TPR) repeat protein
LVRLAKVIHRVGGPGASEADADQYVAKALKLAPKDTGIVVAAADQAQQTGDLKRARALLEERLEADPQDGRLHLSLATVTVREGDRPKAIDMLRSAVKKLPEKHRFELSWTLVNLLIDDNRLAEARQALAGLGKGEGVRDTVTYLEARCWMIQGRWHEAARALEAVRPSFESTPEITTQIDLFLGTCHANLREPAAQLLAFGRAARRSPSSVPARLGLVSALLSLGKTEEGLREYRTLMVLPDAPQDGWVEIARLELERSSRAGKADVGAVDEAVNKAAGEKHDPAALALLRAEVLVARGQQAAARVLLAEQQKANPKHLPFWTTDAVLANRQNGPRAALALLEQAGQPENAGDSVELRLAKAEHIAALSADEAKEALLHLEKQPGLPADKAPPLWLGLAEAHARVRNYADAARLYRQVCELPTYAQDVRLRLNRFEVALRAGDEPGMLRALDEIKSVESGDGLYSQYCQALHHLWKARADSGQAKWLDQAAGLLDRLGQKRPDWMAVVLARADLEELRGNVDKALNLYRQALSQGERSSRVVRQYGQLLLKSRRYSEVDALARQYEKSGGVSAELRRMAAYASARSGDLTQAQRWTSAPAGADPKDFRDVMWRGQVLATVGNYPEAERMLRRAAEMAGEEPDPWVALARFFAATGKKDRAEGVIKTALDKLPSEKRALTAAQCYDALDEFKQAEKYYQQAVADRPKDVGVYRAAAAFYLRVQDLAKAEPCLRQLIEGKVPGSPQDVAWAKYKLAVAIALRGDYRRYGEALDLVGLALDKNGDPLEKRSDITPAAEEISARARVLATQGRAPFRARAIALLEGLNKREALLPEDRFLLAQLYDSNGPEAVWWAKAGEQMRSLVNRLGDDPVFVTQFANTLLRHKEYREAQAQIDRVEKLEKQRRLAAGTLGSVELRVTLLEATGHGAEALALLRDYVAKGKDDPGRIYLLIGALQRRKALAAALDCCEKAWQTCPPEPSGGASLATLKAGQPNPEQYRRVENWLKDALKKKPGSSVLWLQLADLHEMRGEKEKAEIIYREVIERDKDNPVALNNLAWQLSQRPGRGAVALPLINRAIDLLGPQPALLDTRAAVLLSMGRGDLAVADLEKVARDDPSASRHFRLARAHHLTRNTKAALVLLERAMNEGLDPARLQPAEQQSYQEMRADMKK